MSTSGLFNTSAPSFGVDISRYIEQPKDLIYGQNLQDYADQFGTYVSGNGVVSGNTPSLAAVNAIDVSKAPSVLSEKGFNDWSVDEALGNNIVDTKVAEDAGSGFMNWMGTDSAKNTIGLGGLAFTGFGAVNNYRAGQQAKKQWEAENARANEIMAMNREKYATYKADKERLNSGYSGGGLAGSGVVNG